MQLKVCKQSTVEVSGDLTSAAKLLVCPWASYLTYLCLVSSRSQLTAALSNKTINALDALASQGDEWAKSLKLIPLSSTPMGSTGIANKAISICHDEMVHKTEAKQSFNSLKRFQGWIQPSQPLPEIPGITRCADWCSTCSLSC